MRQRVVTPELIDQLPADDPRAIRSRRDLLFVNRIMGSHRWLARVLGQLHRPGMSWVELGAGDGMLGRMVHRQEDGPSLEGMDLFPRPQNWPRDWTWLQGDLFAKLKDHPERWNAATGNLILHHFEDAELERLGQALSRFQVLAFSEPARYWLHRVEGYAISPLFLHPVTRHDLHASVRAGFRGEELADLLGLDRRDWKISCRSTLLGAYRFLAVRNDFEESAT